MAGGHRLEVFREKCSFPNPTTQPSALPTIFLSKCGISPHTTLSMCSPFSPITSAPGIKHRRDA